MPLQIAMRLESLICQHVRQIYFIVNHTVSSVLAFNSNVMQHIFNALHISWPMCMRLVS